MATETSNEAAAARDAAPVPYRWSARMFHWVTVAAIVVMIITGNWMTNRGNAGVWDDLTNALYSSHKLLGFVLLWFVLLRLLNRFVFGVPPEPASLTPFQRMASSAVHWSLYAVLIALPIAGWVGVSMFPALNIFGLFDLPSIAPVDQEMSKQVFAIHHYLGYALVALLAVHIGAALFHAIVQKDGVFQRMWPTRAKSRSDGR